jgi:hypothetical protein
MGVCISRRFLDLRQLNRKLRWRLRAYFADPLSDPGGEEPAGLSPQSAIPRNELSGGQHGKDRRISKRFGDRCGRIVEGKTFSV